MTMNKAVSAILFVVAVSGCSKQEYVSSELTGGESAQYATQKHAYTRAELPDFAAGTSLGDCLAYAALNNAGLEAAFNRWKAALEKVPQVTSLPDPRFSYSYFITEVETRVGPQRQKLSLSQMFPWFGKLELRGDAAAAGAEAARCQYEQQKLKLFFAVKKGYYEYYYLSRAVSVTQENLLLLQSMEEVARSKYQGGKAGQSAVLRFQVGIGKLEDRLRGLRDLRGPTVAKLNAAMNRPIGASLPWPTEILQEDVDFSDEQLSAALLENNPELVGLGWEIEKSKHQIDLAQKDYYPDVSLGVMFIDTRDAVMPTNDSGNDPVAVTASINLPINHGKYRAGEREARARHRAAVAQRKDRENNLLADLHLSLYGFRDAERKIDLYQNALVPTAQQSLNVTQQAFSADKAQFLDVIDAVRMLLEFKLAYERAKVDRGEKLAEIEMLVGKPLTQTIVLDKAE